MTIDRAAVRTSTVGLELQLLRRLHSSTLTHLPSEPASLIDLQVDAFVSSIEQHHATADVDVIHIGGTDIGALVVDRQPDWWHIVDITVLPEHRDAGVGSAALRSMGEAAQRIGNSLTLRVMVTNGRALALYRSLGFVEQPERSTLTHCFMRWSLGEDRPTSSG